MWIPSLILLAAQALPVAPVDLPHRSLPDGSIWFPSTQLRREVAPLPYGDSGLFVATHGGVALHDTVTGETSFFRLPEFPPISPSGSRFPLRISRLEAVGDTVWVATRSGGIHVFDPVSMGFERVISLGEGKYGANLDLVRDPFSDDLWVSRFQHLDRYDAERARWINQDLAFGSTGFRAPSIARVYPDDRWVWVAAQGGLLQWDRGSRNWRRFGTELLGKVERRSTLMPRDVVVGPDHVWVYLTHGNVYNFYIAVFDKATESWTTHRRTGGAGAVEQLANELPDLRWRNGMNFVATLRTLADGATTLLGTHPHRFSPDEQRTLLRMAETVESAMARHGLLDVPDHGYAEQPPEEIELPDLAFTKILGVDHACRVLVATPLGLGLIDLDDRTFTTVDALPFTIGPNALGSSFRGGRRFVLDPNWERGDGPPSLDLFLVDLERLTVAKLRKPRPGRTGRLEGRLAVRSGDAVQVYDPETGRWSESDGIDSFVRAVGFPAAVDLPGRGRVEWATDGLVFRP